MIWMKQMKRGQRCERPKKIYMFLASVNEMTHDL